MNNRINDIIDRYKNYDQLYEVLKKYYINSEISQEKYNETMKEIKNVIASYYLNIDEFQTRFSNKKHNSLLIKISEICDLEKKVKIKDKKVKIYPVKASHEIEEEKYKEIMKKMVDEQIETGISIEDLFDKHVNKLDGELNEKKEMLRSSDMYLYYGNPYYMIERAKFIAECIKFIPGISLNVDDIINPMISFENKYLNDKEDTDKIKDFEVKSENEQFYEDYDIIESYYKKMLVIEEVLAPIVIQYWEQYLTDPNTPTENYRYLTHSFSQGMVAPNLMNKACCSLSTNEIENLMYGSSGLIYDLDVEAVETMCCDDVGSWELDKEKFIERGCPGNWQLTDLDNPTVFFENPKNSKLIMPEIFEKECKKQFLNDGNWSYSEFFLNHKAKIIGVFYVDGCENIEEVEAYAKKYNLPLVNISARVYSDNNIKNK